MPKYLVKYYWVFLWGYFWMRLTFEQADWVELIACPPPRHVGGPHLISWRPCCCSVNKSCLTLCYPMGCTPGFPVLHCIPELAQTHIHWISNTIQPSNDRGCPVVPFSSCLQFFPTPGSFLMSHLFASGGQSVGASASASVLPVNIQDWFPLGFPLGLTGLISS